MNNRQRFQASRNRQSPKVKNCLVPISANKTAMQFNNVEVIELSKKEEAASPSVSTFPISNYLSEVKQSKERMQPMNLESSLHPISISTWH